MTREQCQAKYATQVPDSLRDDGHLQSRKCGNVQRMWVLTFTGLALTAGLLLLGYALVHLHPIYHVEYLTLLVNCGGGFETHAAWVERQHAHPYPACVDRMESVAPAQSASQCSASGGDCGRKSAQSGEEDQSDPDTIRHSRL